MLSVIIATDDSERRLVPTLAALVAGTVAGIVREVIIADAGSRDATAEIADVAGCRLIVAAASPLGARLRAAAASARGPWLLFLKPGCVPDVTWVDEVSRFVRETELSGRADACAAVFRPTPAAHATRSAIMEALAMLAAALCTRPQPRQGLLISKMLYDQLGGHSDNGNDPEADFLRRLGRRRTVILRSGAVMPGA
jgi:hypothetical protein